MVLGAPWRPERPRSVQRLRPNADDAKAKFAAAWGAWIKAAGLNEDTPTAQLKESIPDRRDLYSAMPKRSPREKLFEWRVIKIRSTPAALVGYFTAANADDAIKRAIVEREISDPLTQSRLAAQRVREIG